MQPIPTQLSQKQKAFCQFFLAFSKSALNFLHFQKALYLFVNTLTADDKYSLLNRDNLTQQIPKQLFQKQKAFSQIFLAFSKFALNLEHFQKKDKAHR